MIFGYASVSTEEQNLDMQIDALQQYGIDKLYQEKMTGIKKDRLQLEELLKVLRKGDKIVVYKLDRISRSTKHLIELSEKFKELGVDFISIHDNIDTSNVIGKYLASIAELERDIISEHTKTGLNAARTRGKKEEDRKKTYR